MCGVYDIPAADVEVIGRAHQQGADRPVPRRRAARGRVLPRAARWTTRRGSSGIDPLELRRRNLVRDVPVRDAARVDLRLGRLRALPRARGGARGAGAPTPTTTRVVGTGFGMYVERAGGMFESARVAELLPDGRVLIRSGSSPHGQGHETTFAQIAAERSGVELEDVELRFGDSTEVPRGVGTFASRSVAMGGSARRPGRRRPEGASCGASKDRQPGISASARFESDLVFVVRRLRRRRRDRARDRPPARAADGGGRRRRDDRQPAARRGTGDRRHGAGARRVPGRGGRYDEEGKPTIASFLDYSLLTAAEMPPVDDRVRRVAVAAQPARARRGSARAGRSARRRRWRTRSPTRSAACTVDPPFTEEKLWRALREASS